MSLYYVVIRLLVTIICVHHFHLRHKGANVKLWEKGDVRLFIFLECFPLLMATLIFSILTSIFVITTCLSFLK